MNVAGHEPEILQPKKKKNVDDTTTDNNKMATLYISSLLNIELRPGTLCIIKTE